MKKAELFNLYFTLQSSHPSVSAPISSAQTSKARRALIARPTTSTPSSPAAPGPTPAPRHRRPSTSLGRAPNPVTEGRQPFPGQLPSSAPPTVVPHAPDLRNSTFTHDPQMFFFPSTSFSFPPSQAPGGHPNVRMPPLAGQSPAHFLPLPLPHYALPIPPPSIPGADLCARMPPQTATAPTFPPFNPLQVRSPFSLFSATPQPAPPNAVAAEPPPVTNNIRAQILAEIQDAGTRSRPHSNPSTSLFSADLPINHPLKSLLDTSIDSILQAVSPRTLQTYYTVWKSFKSFHLSHNLSFPKCSLLSVTSFISHLHRVKGLQAGSIKSYLSGIQFFHKLIHGKPAPALNNSQTSLLIKGIQRTRPTRPDTRQPITIDILTRCISSLRLGYHSFNTAYTLEAMFILAFFGFLRCSELTITSLFDPNIHPTISDLQIVDNETISFFIKQSKTDRAKKGHFIYIFNLQTPIQPYHALFNYLQYKRSTSKSPFDPLFTNDSNHPATRFWFQKHLKAVLNKSGVTADHFSSHSFRIGAATTAAQKGLSQQQIKTLGRWSSNAFKTYIRSSRFHIGNAHQALTN
ncbi:hypothetical protein PO909_004499 [Leuciscus waleckii]